MGIVSLFYSYIISWPSYSAYNILLAAFHTVVTGILFLYAFEDIYIYNFLSYFFWIAPFAAFAIILTAVTLTQIPVQIYRWIIVQLAKNKIKNSKAVFIGVIGSYGKTSIAHYLYQVLSQKYTVTRSSPQSTNDIGIAQSILKDVSTETEICIIEVGSYEAGEIKRSAQYIPFSYLILTGIGNNRIDLFGTKNAMLNEYTSLVSDLHEKATIYVSSEISDIGKTKAHIVTYGFSEKDAIHPSHINMSHAFTKARIHYLQQSWNMTTALLGRHSLENLLPVFALCLDTGMKPSEILNRLRDLKHQKGSFSVHRGIHKSVIILDTCEPNLRGFLQKISFLNYFSHKTKIIITDGIHELGVEKRASYEEITNKAKKNNIQLYTTDLLFKDLKHDDSIHTFNDVSSLQKQLLLSVDKGTVVLIEGPWPPLLTEALLIHK